MNDLACKHGHITPPECLACTLEELESLHQENQKLKGQLETVVKGSFDASAVMAKENAHLRERMNQLTSDYEGTIKRLREALEKIGWLPQDKAYGSSFPEIARKALNPPKKS